MIFTFLAKCYINRENYRENRDAFDIFIPENQIVWIKRILADTQDKQSAKLFQIKLADGSTFVVKDNEESQRALFGY